MAVSMDIDIQDLDTDSLQHYISVVRFKLNQDKIKLWLMPYTTANGEKGEIPLDLVKRYTCLGIPENILLQVFEDLRSHAVSKLKSRDEFKSTGIAALNLHLQWITKEGQRGKKITSIRIPLKEKVSCLFERIELEMSLDHLDLSSVKIIHKGVLLKPEESFETQNIINSSNLMIILKEKHSVDANQEKDLSDRVEETKKVAKALASRSDSGHRKKDHYFLEINDQQGNKISLPEEERKSLSLALTLHEKGRSLFKQKKYLESLLIFLEADEQFRNCRSELLGSVDNYAVLCLDIVWCYYELKKLDQLPDAEERLNKCKECLKKSYGENLERLTFVKGNDVNELVLFVRVNLMEAVCSYCRGNAVLAKQALDKAETHLKRLEIDDDKFAQLISMGFSTTEARLSLRSCRGDVTMAIEYIARKREEQQMRDERERKERKDRKASRKYGKTASGDTVSIANLSSLKQMGYSHEMSLEALKQSNNEINQALEILQNNPEMLIMALQSDVVPEHLIQQFVAIGFETSLVKKTLRKCKNDVEKCMNELLRYQQEQHDQEGNSSSGRTDQVSTKHDSESSDDEDDEEANRLDEQVTETLRDISQHDRDDYLDLTLTEEAEIINKYRLLLASSKH